MLENEKIKLRALEPEDLEDLYRWENDTQLWLHGCTIAPYSRYTLREYIAQGGGDFYENKQLRLVVMDQSTQHAIGMVDLFDYDPFHQRCALGVLIDEQYRQKGMAESALNLLCEYAFRYLSIHMLYAHVSASNTGSLRLFEKLGFQQQGILKDWLRIGDRFEDVFLLQYIKH